MPHFSVTYRHGHDGSTQRVTVTAQTATEAISKVPNPWRTIRAISVLCCAPTKSGQPCSRWSHSQPCPQHATA